MSSYDLQFILNALRDCLLVHTHIVFRCLKVETRGGAFHQ